jgi:hypothetical protein
VVRSSGLLACALVVAPAASERSVAGFEWSLASGATASAPALRSRAARSLAGNAMAGAVPFLERIATMSAAPASEAALELPLAASLALHLAPRALAPTACGR